MRKVEGGSRPKVPLRKTSHEERVEVARKIAFRIVDSYKADVLAVCISGFTAKKLDRPYSDLEMFCVITDGHEIANKYYILNGLLVQIEYFQESNFLKEATRVGFDWHLAADEFRNRIVLFEREGWLKLLERAVEENERADFSRELRWAILAMTESLAAVRNARWKKDWRDLRTRAFYLAWDTARVVFLYNRSYVLTTSSFWKQLFDFTKQPEGFKQLIDIAAGFAKSTHEELVASAEQLWKVTMEMLEGQGIPIEAKEIII
jgi:kanamycin nucleotidyltransferase